MPRAKKKPTEKPTPDECWEAARRLFIRVPEDGPRWVASDGTVAYVGGFVDGRTELAHALRGLFRSFIESGTWDPGPIPSPDEPFDENNPTHIDTVVRREIDRWWYERAGVVLVSVPKVPPLPKPPPDPDGGRFVVNGRVYEKRNLLR